MRPWTTRTLQAAVVAAGFAAVGTGTASAAETTPTPMPDLTQVPDQIGFHAPLDLCQTPQGVEYGREKVPCANTSLNADSPNVIKKVGSDIARTSNGLAGEMQDRQPLLAPGKPNSMLGHVFAETTRVSHMTKTRPTVGTSVDPRYTGVLDDHAPQGGLLNAEISPYHPGHQGFSAADTAADLTAAQGFHTEPVADPVGLVMPTVSKNPTALQGPPATLGRLDQVVPALKQLPANNVPEAGTASSASQVLHNAATSAPQVPVDASSLPGVNNLTGMLH